MKREYTKPIVVFEDFTLSTNIAGDCESMVGNPSKGTCAIIASGNINLFSSTVNACDYTEWNGTDYTADDVYNGFCYHVPTEYNNLFNS